MHPQEKVILPILRKTMEKQGFVSLQYLAFNQKF